MDLSELEKIQKAIPEFQYGAVFYSNGLIIQSVFKPESNVKKIGSDLSEIIKNFREFLEEIEDEPTDYKRMVFYAGDLIVVLLKIGEDANTLLIFSKLSQPIDSILRKIRDDLTCLSKLSDVPLATIQKGKIEEEKERLQKVKEELEKKEHLLEDDIDSIEVRSEFRVDLKQDLGLDIIQLQDKIRKNTTRLEVVSIYHDELSIKESLTPRDTIMKMLVGSEKERLEKKIKVLNQKHSDAVQKKEKLLAKIIKEEKDDEKILEELIEDKEKLQESKEKIIEKEVEIKEKEQEIQKQEEEITEILKTEDED